MSNAQEFKSNLSDIKIVAVRLRMEELGIDVSHVREIARVTDITVIHERTGYIQGVTNLRGQVITVVDIAKMLGFPPLLEIPNTARMVIMDCKDRILGFIVDEVRDVLEITAGHIEPASGSGKTIVKADYCKGIGSVAGRAVILLNVERIFKDL